MKPSRTTTMNTLHTSGDSSDNIIAPRVSTWITLAEGRDGVFRDIDKTRWVSGGAEVNKNVDVPVVSLKFKYRADGLTSKRTAFRLCISFVSYDFVLDLD